MKKVECGGCGQRIWVKGLVDPCNPLCEFCRPVLEAESSKEAKPEPVLPEIKIACCCDWCGGMSRVIKLRSYGKPLCEFCRAILGEENAKAGKKSASREKKIALRPLRRKRGSGQDTRPAGISLPDTPRGEEKRKSEKTGKGLLSKIQYAGKESFAGRQSRRSLLPGSSWRKGFDAGVC